MVALLSFLHSWQASEDNVEQATTELDVFPGELLLPQASKVPTAANVVTAKAVGRINWRAPFQTMNASYHQSTRFTPAVILRCISGAWFAFARGSRRAHSRRAPAANAIVRANRGARRASAH
jgi:hypothetical protein